MASKSTSPGSRWRGHRWHRGCASLRRLRWYCNAAATAALSLLLLHCTALCLLLLLRPAGYHSRTLGMSENAWRKLRARSDPRGHPGHSMLPELTSMGGGPGWKRPVGRAVVRVVRAWAVEGCGCAAGFGLRRERLRWPKAGVMGVPLSSRDCSFNPAMGGRTSRQGLAHLPTPPTDPPKFPRV